MAEDIRPDPDALLAAIQKSEAATKRGKFKVFLGMAAGVGKTYAMLRAGQRAVREGVDVVIGYVETHGRKETEALVGGVPLIARRKVDYRGVTLEEMDLDALLARRPQLALVDELPHTNAPGSRHAKRYQDVIELLGAGIDVYTTMNVQHAESRVDTVRQITGSAVQETVPDSVLDGAEMELIDLPPEDLLKRLDEGKVYVPERAEQAMMNFCMTTSRRCKSPGRGDPAIASWSPSAPALIPRTWCGGRVGWRITLIAPGLPFMSSYRSR